MVEVQSGGRAARVQQPGGNNVPARRKSSNWLKIRSCDYSLIFMVVFLVLFGTVMMYSATLYTESYFRKQAVFAIAGIVIMLVVSLIDYHILKKFAPVIFILALISLMLLLVPQLRVELNNSARWLKFLGLSFQPAEIFKIAVIIFNAAVLNKCGKKIQKASVTLEFIGLAIIEGGAVVVFSDNLSSGIIVIAVAMCMLFVSKPNKKVCFILIALAVVFVAGALFYYESLDYSPAEFATIDFRTQRVLRWLHPEKYNDEKNFQTLHSLYAIGSGSFGGKGLGNSTEKMILPEAMNDMIFAIVCEELGFVGSTFLLVLYGILMQRLAFIARNAKEFFGSLISVGIFGHIGVQVMLNVAVATNSMPNTGVTLPFFSYGGTALVILLAEMGIALSVSRHISLE